MITFSKKENDETLSVIFLNHESKSEKKKVFVIVINLYIFLINRDILSWVQILKGGIFG